MCKGTQRESDFDKFVSDITPDVLAVLKEELFFEQLEMEVFPGGGIDGRNCKHDFSITEKLLSQHQHDADAIQDVIAVMQSMGGCCDCEIVLNAAPESNVRESYWKSEQAKLVDGKQ